MVVNMVKSNKIIFHWVINVLLVVVEVFHLINYHKEVGDAMGSLLSSRRHLIGIESMIVCRTDLRQGRTFRLFGRKIHRAVADLSALLHAGMR